MLILRLNSLQCHNTETITGPDKAYIIVNGNIVWGPKKINDDQSKDLEGISIEFSDNCKIELYDDDSLPGDPDDHLGTAYVWARQVDQEQHISFNGSSWSYTLHCCVKKKD